ncbi:MAG: septum formation initiator family protein [Longimicrobiaceae bacterium]
MALRPRGRHLLAAAVLAAALYYAAFGGEYSAFDLLRLNRDRRDAEARLARTRREVDSLKAQALKLERDPATIERVARERFGMIREGETLYRFVPVDSAAKP